MPDVKDSAACRARKYLVLLVAENLRSRAVDLNLNCSIVLRSLLLSLISSSRTQPEDNIR